MKTKKELSDRVELILETSIVRIVKVIKGWDKGAVLIQNQNELLNGWGDIVRVSEKDIEILMNNIKENKK